MEKKIVRYRYNVLNINSFASFAGVRGGVNQGCKDVYFVRALAFQDDFTYDIAQMDTTLRQSMAEGRLFYKKIQSLPPLTEYEQIAYYSSCYEKWAEDGRKEALTEASALNMELAEALGLACNNVLKLYHRSRADLSASMEKNFVVKLLYWFDAVLCGDLPACWNGEHAVKIVAEDVAREQEYLFYYMLTQLGADVLLVQQKKDFEGGSELENLSQAFTPQKDWRPLRPQAALNENLGGNLNKNKEAIVSQRAKRKEKSFEELALLAASVVMIEVHDNSGEIVCAGSGIMIGEGGYILTNNHVAGGGRFYSVRIEEDERIYETDEAIKYNPSLDLAIIRIGRKLKPIPLYKGEEPLARGQKVVAIGSPLGLFNSVSDGIISGFRKIGDVDMIQFTAPISHGSSGGALLNMSGEIIGISTAGMDGGQNLNLAVRYEWIHMFVKGFVQK